jgi:pimeloyl-ACP methyl ester carboxylesterase
VQALAAGHEVIMPDLQGHGRTADIDRPIDPRLMAGDIAALIGHLGLDRPDVVGYSLGGGVSFWTAVDHPEVVRRMVMVSTNIKRSAIYPEMLAQQEQVGAAAVPYMVDTPMYQLYQRVAPRPDEFGRLLDKMGASMAVDFDFSDEVRGLRVPTMFVAADADMFPPSHAAEVFTLLGGGQRDGGWTREGRPAGGHALAIIAGTTHYDIFGSPLTTDAVIAFLDALP